METCLKCPLCKNLQLATNEQCALSSCSNSETAMFKTWEQKPRHIGYFGARYELSELQSLPTIIAPNTAQVGAATIPTSSLAGSQPPVASVLPQGSETVPALGYGPSNPTSPPGLGSSYPTPSAGYGLRYPASRTASGPVTVSSRNEPVKQESADSASMPTTTPAGMATEGIKNLLLQPTTSGQQTASVTPSAPGLSESRWSTQQSTSPQETLRPEQLSISQLLSREHFRAAQGLPPRFPPASTLMESALKGQQASNSQGTSKNSRAGNPASPAFQASRTGGESENRKRSIKQREGATPSPPTSQAERGSRKKAKH